MEREHVMCPLTRLCLLPHRNVAMARCEVCVPVLADRVLEGREVGLLEFRRGEGFDDADEFRLDELY